MTPTVDDVATEIVQYMTAPSSGSLLPSHECVPNLIRQAIAQELYRVAIMLTGDLAADSRMIERCAENIMSTSRSRATSA